MHSGIWFDSVLLKEFELEWFLIFVIHVKFGLFFCIFGLNLFWVCVYTLEKNLWRSSWIVLNCMLPKNKALSFLLCCFFFFFETFFSSLYSLRIKFFPGLWYKGHIIHKSQYMIGWILFYFILFYKNSIFNCISSLHTLCKVREWYGHIWSIKQILLLNFASELDFCFYFKMSNIWASSPNINLFQIFV